MPVAVPIQVVPGEEEAVLEQQYAVPLRVAGRRHGEEVGGQLPRSVAVENDFRTGLRRQLVPVDDAPALEVFGEAHGCRMFRKVAPWYSKRFGPVHEFNKRVVLMSSKAEFHDILESYLRWRQQFLDERGELRPQYRPPPLVASFMQEPGVAQRLAIPVPKGPVEVW